MYASLLIKDNQAGKITSVVVVRPFVKSPALANTCK